MTNGLLENFNVRTLYDKLEDQTLHISSQLARHQADLRGFYDRISQQTEGLKKMLDNLDVSKLAEATEAAAMQMSSEGKVRYEEDENGNKREGLFFSVYFIFIKTFCNVLDTLDVLLLLKLIFVHFVHSFHFLK